MVWSRHSGSSSVTSRCWKISIWTDPKTPKWHSSIRCPVGQRDLSEAIENRASDIHIEAQVWDQNSLSDRWCAEAANTTGDEPVSGSDRESLEDHGELNIAEKRVPQDGRIKLRVLGREVDIRVSIIPMLHGEGVVMRVLDKENLKFSLRGIGMSEEVYENFQKLIRLPHGIVLVKAHRFRQNDHALQRIGRDKV